MITVSERVPRKALGLSGSLMGIAFLLIGAGNCIYLILDLRALGGNLLTLLVSAILALIGLALIPLSVRFARGKNYSLKWVTIGFLLYFAVLTILSLSKTWQLDSDTILNGEVAIMIALVGASTRFKGRIQGLLAGLPLLYITVLLSLVEGFSTSDILSFHTGLLPPPLGLLFSWRPFEIGGLFLASFGGLARAFKKRVTPIAFLALASYSLGVLIPLLLPSTDVYHFFSKNFTDPLSLLVSPPKLLGVIVLLIANAVAAGTAVAGLILNRRGGPPIVSPSQVRQIAAPTVARSYSNS